MSKMLKIEFIDAFSEWHVVACLCQRLHDNTIFTLLDKNIYQPQRVTPARTLFKKGLKSRVLKLSFLSLKMMVKSGVFKIHRAPSEIPAKLSGQFGHPGQIFLHWAAATLKGLG